MVDAKFDLVLRPISHGNPAMPFTDISILLFIDRIYFSRCLIEFFLFNSDFETNILLNKFGVSCTPVVFMGKIAILIFENSNLRIAERAIR